MQRSFNSVEHTLRSLLMRWRDKGGYVLRGLQALNSMGGRTPAVSGAP